MPLTVPMDEELRLALPDLTRAERQLASHILSNYPVAALGSITALAREGGVSSPTVVRLVQKLGYKGYPDFQRALRGQVEAMLVSPLVKQARAVGAAEGHVLSRFVGAVMENLQATAAQIDPPEFDAADAPVAAAQFQLALPVAEEWLQMIGRAKSGDYVSDRPVELDEAEIERVRNAPDQCPNCGAAITSPVLRGQNDITCEYCGVVTRI